MKVLHFISRNFVELLIVICILTLVIIVPYGVIISANSESDYNKNLYKTWCKVNPEYELTLKEWHDLKMSELLPRQVK